jgi:hypothetical protein
MFEQGIDSALLEFADDIEPHSININNVVSNLSFETSAGYYVYRLTACQTCRVGVFVINTISQNSLLLVWSFIVDCETY